MSKLYNSRKVSAECVRAGMCVSVLMNFDISQKSFPDGCCMTAPARCFIFSPIPIVRLQFAMLLSQSHFVYNAYTYTQNIHTGGFVHTRKHSHCMDIVIHSKHLARWRTHMYHIQLCWCGSWKTPPNNITVAVFSVQHALLCACVQYARVSVCVRHIHRWNNGWDWVCACTKPYVHLLLFPFFSHFRYNVHSLYSKFKCARPPVKFNTLTFAH